MCGIIGLFHREQPVLKPDEERMKRLLEKFSYRGPDGSGIWSAGKYLLGHRRLSIIDLSSSGAQPFCDEKTGRVITYNGEIYNFKEIRARLVSIGYQFRSASDTEVLLAAYDHFGIECLPQLRGMFAFCILDPKQNRALLARDSAGEKPLYYYMDRKQFVFTSEIKTLHAFPGVDLSIDHESVRAFFTLQYIPGPHTVYEQVRRLPGGCALEIDLDRWSCRETRFWSFEGHRGVASTPEELDGLLSESVRYRLVSDVEVGLLLSGGIDSTLLASYADQNGAKLRTFTATFDEGNLDESLYARQAAEKLGFHQVTVTAGHLTPEIFDQVIFHADELLGDPACVPTFLLAKEVSRHVKVVLSGEGADELFWGYDTYRFERVWRWMAWLQPLFSNPGMQKVVSNWELSTSVPASITRLGKVLSAISNLGASRWTSVFADHSLEHLFTSPTSQPVAYLQEMEARLAQLENHLDPFSASLSLNLLYWLCDDLLMKVDRMTMAHSVEARAPYLDPQLIQAALRLPQKHKLRGRMGKFMLRQWVEKRFPGDVGRTLAWRNKHGFEVPVAAWLRSDLRECVEDRLSPEKIAQSGFFDTTYVSVLKKRFYASPADTPLRRKLWLLLCFQSWHAMHEKGFGFRFPS